MFSQLKLVCLGGKSFLSDQFGEIIQAAFRKTTNWFLKHNLDKVNNDVHGFLFQYKKGKKKAMHINGGAYKPGLNLY